MATNQITDFLKYANLQMAAEALFTHDARQGIQEPRKIEQGPLGLSNLTFGNGHASVFTPTSAAQFTPGWTVVQHKSNTATGFSGTLFRYDGPTDAAKGLTIGELVLSMRSTEFIDDSGHSMWGQVLHPDIFKPMPRLPQHEKDCPSV